MAKRIYVGVGNTARRVKKAYIGMGGVARRIKKAYIGVGGVARPCFATEPEYWGETSQPLSVARSVPHGSSIGNYALFGGGYISNSSGYVTSFKTVDVYDDKLTAVSGVELSQKNMQHSAISNNNYAFFYKGGNVGREGKGDTWTFIYSIDVFDKSLTKTTIDDSGNTAAWSVSSVSLGGYALFAGGFMRSASGSYDVSAAVYAYNESLTKTSLESMDDTKYASISVTVGNYALFIGGSKYYPAHGGYIGNINDIQVYNSSLTKVSVTFSNTWNIENLYDGAATAGNYAVSSATTAISKSLTYQNISSPFTESHGGTCISLDGYALHAKGYKYSNSRNNYTGEVEIMNPSLTKTTGKSLRYPRDSFAGINVGDYVLFAGGTEFGTGTGITTFFDTVEAYVI